MGDLDTETQPQREDGHVKMEPIMVMIQLQPPPLQREENKPFISATTIRCWHFCHHLGNNAPWKISSNDWEMGEYHNLKNACKFLAPSLNIIQLFSPSLLSP